MESFLSNPAATALVSALITATFLFLGRVTVDRRSGDQQFSNNLRDDLLQEIKGLKEEIRQLKEDNNQWRERYWELQAEIADLKNTLKGIGGVGL